jgi:hypothetical protein
VSVLLRQPEGFEGLGWVHVDVPSDDLSAAKCPNVPDPFFDLHAAVLAVRAELHGGHDVIATVGKPYWDPVGVPERLEHLPPASTHAVVAVKRSLAPEHGLTLPHLDGWIEELKEPRIGYTFRPGEKLVVEPSDRFDVLLRHRTRSIPQAN